MHDLLTTLVTLNASLDLTLLLHIKQILDNSFCLNHLLHEFLFSSVLERLPNIGSYRLPTQRQDNFFYYPFMF